MTHLGIYELNRVHCGHVLDMLAGVPDETIQCVVTSPPYWGLRDYGIPPSIWDGDSGCQHEFTETPAPGGNGDGKSFRRDKAAGRESGGSQPGFCIHCGAWRGCLGLEPTPELFIQHMVLIFTELRRVLRKDGTLWLNLGDSYAAGTSAARKKGKGDVGGWQRDEQFSRVHAALLKPKDLVGIPWRVALALQADGWYLRSDIIWAKPNPMPESVTDRPTKAHEYIFLLTKSAKYFYDADAVREAHSDNLTATHNLSTVHSNHTAWAGAPAGVGRIRMQGKRQYNPGGRNSRTIWEMPTQPTPEAHFATFPEELPRRCIKAGTSEKGACPQCGAPWERVVEKSFQLMQDRSPEKCVRKPESLDSSSGWGGSLKGYTASTTTGWRPTCKCEAGETVPCIVLDPFAGTAKTGKVAIELGRQFSGFDISAEYVKKFAQPRVIAAEKGITIKELDAGQGVLFSP
jgi:DNA modification methylase